MLKYITSFHCITSRWSVVRVVLYWMCVVMVNSMMIDEYNVYGDLCNFHISSVYSAGFIRDLENMESHGI